MFCIDCKRLMFFNPFRSFARISLQFCVLTSINTPSKNSIQAIYLEKKNKIKQKSLRINAVTCSMPFEYSFINSYLNSLFKSFHFIIYIKSFSIEVFFHAQSMKNKNTDLTCFRLETKRQFESNP